MTSLYFHVPFCTHKCPYCHFYVVPNQARYHPLLLDALLLELERSLPLVQEAPIASLYFGGGTPSLFGPPNIGRLLDWVRTHATLAPDCEITLEANPEDVSPLPAYRALGINRLSLGVQSLDERSLQGLERTHSAKQAKEALFAARDAGFDNVSIDLMYDLPGQTEASWETTLEQLPHLPFHHLSLYNLTIEPHTPFHARKLTQPGPEKSFYFLQSALHAFAKMGLERYEISAFARNGLRSKHNSGYWTARNFLGFGPSAFSYWKGERYRNVSNLSRYAAQVQSGASPVDFRERLAHDAQERERLVIGLRLLEGVVIEAGWDEKTRAGIEALVAQGLLCTKGERLLLTERGTLFYDTVAAELV